MSAPAELQSNVVGCYECHSLNADKCKDNVEHFGVRINVVVSPGDCKTCHPTEVDQYVMGKTVHALDNLEKNPDFHLLVQTTLSTKAVSEGKLTPGKINNNSKNETRYACHGTRVEVKGTRSIPSGAGDIVVPELTNWPNMGVGRINPDGTHGTCTVCHPRHSFSIEVARKPSTCGECHLEPDVPAYNVYNREQVWQSV